MCVLNDKYIKNNLHISIHLLLMSDDYYKTLDVPRDADETQIKKAYRKLAMKHHPDRGGDEVVFKQIGEAYAVLSDPQKRGRYDQFGKQGVDESGGGMSHEDVFASFFGGGGGGATTAAFSE